MKNLKDKIKKLPNTPGIYLFYNTKKELVYVGKATSLRNRVRSYFVGVKTSRPIEQMIHEVTNIKVIETDSVLEAIILEGKYIKKFRPKYNVDWKDDKSWNYIVITKDLYPRVETIREHELKKVDIGKNDIFGPYPNLKVKEMMRLLQKLFYISTCFPPLSKGRLGGVAKKLKKNFHPTSILPSGRGGGKPCFYHQLGQCLGVCTGEISSTDYKKKVINPLKQFLKGNKRRLVINLERKMKLESKNKNFEEAGRLRDQIKNLKKIQDIALLNKSFIESLPSTRLGDEILKQVQDDSGVLGVRNLRIEGYDISNLGISDKVGSMVVFKDSEPSKKDYRKFNIKTVSGQSDVDCLAEVLERRLKHLEWDYPDIFLIDGGLPQVNRVKKILKTGLITIPVVGIAKGPKRQKNEFIFDQKDGNMVKFVRENQNLLINVRDEAHRFAIKFNREKRKIKY